jgi:flagellar motility protein MotE (MotC chaperone)
VITTLATVGYFDIKSDVNEQKNTFDTEKMEYKEEIKDMLQEELKYEREKREKISEDIGEIKGDIKVILEKTRNLENDNTTSPSIHNTNGPDNSVPPPVHH